MKPCIFVLTITFAMPSRKTSMEILREINDFAAEAELSATLYEFSDAYYQNLAPTQDYEAVWADLLDIIKTENLEKFEDSSYTKVKNVPTTTTTVATTTSTASSTTEKSTTTKTSTTTTTESFTTTTTTTTTRNTTTERSSTTTTRKTTTNSTATLTLKSIMNNSEESLDNLEKLVSENFDHNGHTNMSALFEYISQFEPHGSSAKLNFISLLLTIILFL